MLDIALGTGDNSISLDLGVFPGFINNFTSALFCVVNYFSRFTFSFVKLCHGFFFCQLQVVLAFFTSSQSIGDQFFAVINGRKRQLSVVGTALSPEFIYTLGPGSLLPDDARFGVIWMGRDALAAAYDMQGAFNSVRLTLLRGRAPAPVIAELDAMLERHGGTGSVARADQISNWFVQNELAQIRTMATILPTIFLVVSALLTNAVLARLIAIERREISLMKAFGYSDLAVGWHYAKLALAMTTVGVILGWSIGAVLGRWNTELYSSFFRFPFLFYRPGGAEFVISAGVAMGAGLSGAIWAVRGTLLLTPAEAMRPPVPERFRDVALPERITGALDTPTRIILRHMLRTPLRSGASVIGVALAVALLVTAMQWNDAITLLVRGHFLQSQHQDAVIGFLEPKSTAALHALDRLPGVLAVEPLRMVSADLSHGRAAHRGGLTGLPQDARLQVVHDVRGWDIPVPPGGVVLGALLADKLGVAPGDRIEVEVLERDHPRFTLPVTAVHRTWIAMPAYVSLSTLNRAMGAAPKFEFAMLRVDPAFEQALFDAVEGFPLFEFIGVSQLTRIRLG